MHNKSEQCDLLGLGIMPFDLLFAVDKFPKPEIKTDATSMVMLGGGPVPTVCVGLARLNLKTALVAAIGDDPFGKMGLSELRKAGIDDRFVMVKKNKNSALAAGWVEKGSGRRTLVLSREVVVKPGDLKLSRLPIPKVIHLDGRDMPATLKLARWGKKIGALVSFDIGSIRNDVSPVFKYVDHLVVADGYAFPFTGCRTAMSAIKKLAKHCPGTIVITEGIKGSTGCEAGSCQVQPAYKVKAVDTTGAGDAYHVGYLYGLLRGATLAERMKIGAAVAALKCGKPGARAGLPTLSELKKYLRSNPDSYPIRAAHVSKRGRPV